MVAGIPKIDVNHPSLFAAIFFDSIEILASLKLLEKLIFHSPRIHQK